MKKSTLVPRTLLAMIGCLALTPLLSQTRGQSSDSSAGVTIVSPDTVPTGPRSLTITPGRAMNLVRREGVSEGVQQLVQKWKETSEKDQAGREKIEDELLKVLREEFDRNQQLRERQIQDLQTRLDRLREIQARRANNKDDIVERHAQNLIFDADGMGWGGGEHPEVLTVTEDLRGPSQELRVEEFRLQER